MTHELLTAYPCSVVNGRAPSAAGPDNDVKHNTQH